MNRVPVARIFNLSVSPEIVVRCANSLVLVLVVVLVIENGKIEDEERGRGRFWLRLRRAAPYRRFEIGNTSKKIPTRPTLPTPCRMKSCDWSLDIFLMSSAENLAFVRFAISRREI